MNANLIRAKMAEKGVTQGETAQAITISVNSLSRKMNGKREFTLSEVIRLCEFLEIENPASVFLPQKSQICNDSSKPTNEKAG